MAVLRTAVSMLASFDPDVEDMSPEANWRKAKRLVAQVPTIIADLHRVRSGQPLLSPDPNFGISANFLYMLRGTPPNELERKSMEVLMVLHGRPRAERQHLHRPRHRQHAVRHALGAVRRARRAQGPAARRRQPAGDGDDPGHPRRRRRCRPTSPACWRTSKRIMGFGHRVYRTEDPRTRHLRDYSELLCESPNQQHLHEIAQRIEQAVMDAKGMYPNVDFYSATVQHALGIPPEYFTAVFAASRTAGWIAHIIEQYADNRLIRPTSKYMGEMGLPVRADRSADGVAGPKFHRRGRGERRVFTNRFLRPPRTPR